MKEDIFVYRPVNNQLKLRLFKWYESGPLGCGPDSLPWLDLEKHLTLPDNSFDISKEIRENVGNFPQLSGGVAGIIPFEVNQQHGLPYYMYHVHKYVPIDVRLKAKSKWDIENWLFENVCDKIWSVSLVIRENKTDFWLGKNSNSCVWNTDKFPLLQQWVEGLNVFDEIGRVVIFKNNPGHKVFAHRDDIFAPHSNHFINFQFNKVRPAYIYDDIKKEKIYINSRIYMFNEHDVHGVDAETEEDFTVRIDGKFTKDFSNQIGLLNGVVWDYSCKTGKNVENLKFYEY